MSQAGDINAASGPIPPQVFTKFNVQTGTSPVVTSNNTVTFNGATVAAGTHPVRTDGTGAATMALEVQLSQAIASTDATKVGLANFDSAKFTVDNGFVSTSGTGIGQTITGQSGGALSPTAGNWNIYAGETNVNNDAGIQTSGSGSTLTVQLTNRITGTVTTTDATPTTLVSVPLGAVAGVYLATGDVTAYNVTDAAGAAYTYEGAATTDGVSATEIGVEQRNQFEQAAMASADFTFGVSGNNAFVEVVGIAGKEIHWSCLFNYRFVG